MYAPSHLQCGRVNHQIVKAVVTVADRRVGGCGIIGRNVRLKPSDQLQSLGEGTAAVLGTDLGYGYIDENRTTS